MPVFEIEEGGKRYQVEAANIEEASKPINATAEKKPEPSILKHPLDYIGGRIAEGAKSFAAAADPTRPVDMPSGKMFGNPLGFVSSMGQELGAVVGTGMDIATRAPAEAVSDVAGMLPGTSPRGHVRS